MARIDETVRAEAHPSPGSRDSTWLLAILCLSWDGAPRVVLTGCRFLRGNRSIGNRTAAIGADDFGNSTPVFVFCNHVAGKGVRSENWRKYFGLDVDYIASLFYYNRTNQLL